MKKSNLILSVLLLILLTLTNCGSTSDEKDAINNAENNTSSTEGSSVMNAESSTNTEVTIGKQVWMTENLNVDRFRNGDLIPEARTNEEWERAGNEGKPAWCYYNNDAANGKKYGKLYNWYAVNDARGLAPKGYHIPSDAEWTLLIDYLGGANGAGVKMKSTNGWIESGNGNNNSGFSGLPGGYRSDSGTFNYFGDHGNWWSSTESDTSDAGTRNLNGLNGNVGRSSGYERDGFSVRCLRD